MSRVDQIIESLRKGVTASETATAAGVSRAYVYQIAAKHNISLPNGYLRHVEAPDRGCRARIITGGVPVKISATAAGTVSEMLVCADLIARGWLPYLPPVRNRYHDIIAYNGSEIATIEVRSAYRNANGKTIFQKQPNDNSDFYALVVTGEPVEYQPELPEAKPPSPHQ